MSSWDGAWQQGRPQGCPSFQPGIPTPHTHQPLKAPPSRTLCPPAPHTPVRTASRPPTVHSSRPDEGNCASCRHTPRCPQHETRVLRDPSGLCTRGPPTWNTFPDSCHPKPPDGIGDLLGTPRDSPMTKGKTPIAGGSRGGAGVAQRGPSLSFNPDAHFIERCSAPPPGTQQACSQTRGGPGIEACEWVCEWDRRPPPWDSVSLSVHPGETEAPECVRTCVAEKGWG